MSAQDELFAATDDGGMAAVLLQLADLSDRLGALESLLADEPDRAGYTPIPPPEWWRLPDADRADAIARLGAWVDEVYRPGYGHMARRLPQCWREHNLCLFMLDFLSELWSVLYLRDKRSPSTLAGQAEWHIRHLPAAADLMEAEARGCEHSRARPAGAAR